LALPAANGPESVKLQGTGSEWVPSMLSPDWAAAFPSRAGRRSAWPRVQMRFSVGRLRGFSKGAIGNWGTQSVTDYGVMSVEYLWESSGVSLEGRQGGQSHSKEITRDNRVDSVSLG